MRSDPLSTMIEALGLEVAAIKKSGGSMSIELFGGTFVALTNGQYLYKFPLPTQEGATAASFPNAHVIPNPTRHTKSKNAADQQHASTSHAKLRRCAQRPDAPRPMSSHSASLQQ